MKHITQKNRPLAQFICRKAFKQKYRVFVNADTIVHNIHLTLFYNKDNFQQKFNKHICKPLLNINASESQSKRHVICFLRRLVKYYGSVLVQQRKSILVHGKPAMQYLYCLVRYL